MTTRVLPDGRWLLELEGRRFLLPAELGRRVLNQGPPQELIDYCRRTRPTRRLLVKMVLLPACLVSRLVAPLIRLAAWPVLALGIIGGGGFLAAVRTAHHSPEFSWLQTVVWIVLLAIWHELGHAAALQRSGGRPGSVGVGWATILPVFWCDVSEVGLLPRADRLRVDLAGVAWQLGAGAAVSAIGGVFEHGEMVVAGRAALMAAAWSLLPLVKTDGAWALADALDLPSLEATLPPDRRHGRERWLGAAVRMFSAVLLVGCALILPWRLVHRLEFLWQGPRALDALVAVTVGALGTIVFIVAIKRAIGLVRAVLAERRSPPSYSS
jgi:hypothetical protein